MPLITDPDQLTDSAADLGAVEVFINTTTKTIKLNIAGSLSTDGVTLKALYSFLKEEWRNDPFSKNLAAFPFPMTPITDESFEFGDGWDLLNDTARYLIRTAGWTVKNIAGGVTQKWAGVIGLGAIEANDQLYFQQVSGGAAVDFQLTGQVNQAVQIFKDEDGDGNTSEGTDFDRRSYLKLFTREQGQLYDSVGLSDIGVGQMDSIAYRFPISTGADLKITHADVLIDADTNNVADIAPYDGMSITYYAVAEERTIGGVARNFGIVIDGNSGTAEQIYEFVQWSLRRTTDIDEGTGTLTGKIADELLQFVGDSLKTLAATNPAGGGTGVFIDNFLTSDTNRLTFTDNVNGLRTFPYVASLTINFGENLRNDASAKYWVYFTNDTAGDDAGNDFGTAGAIIVDDNAGVDMAGNVGGAASVQKSFNYDGNVQRGTGSNGDDAPITVVGIGLITGQYVKATGTIAKSISNSISLVAALERNYSNPA
jgi:hypothetical protein